MIQRIEKISFRSTSLQEMIHCAVALTACLLPFLFSTIHAQSIDKIAPQASATPHEQVQDSSRVAAQTLFTQGQGLLAEGTARSLRKAIEKFEETLPFWREVGEQRAEAVTLSHIAKAYDSLGEKHKARDYYDRALSILQATGDRPSVAATLNNIGLIYDALGEKQKALDYYNRALPILRGVGDRRVEAYTISNIGLVYDSLGEKQKALDYYNQALAILRDVGDRPGEAATLNNIGFVYDSLAEKQKALHFFGEALVILRAIGDQRVEAITLNNIGYVHDSLGEKQKALDHFNRSLPILRLVGERRVEAVTLNNIGLVNLSLGEKRGALDYFDQALPLRRAVGDRPGEAITLSDTGYAYSSLGEQQKALDYYAQSLSISRAVGDRSVEASTLHRIAQVERTLGNLTQSRARVEAALAIIESLRTKVISQELRASYFASVQQYFETYIDVLMRLHERHPAEGHDSAALQASERARARSLLESLAEAHADIRHGIAPALLERERSLQRMLNARAAAQTRLLNSSGAAQQAAALKKEIEELLTQYQNVQARIRASSPRYAALTQPRPLSLREIQQQVLDSDTLLLEYALGDQRSYLWAVTSTAMKSFVLPPRAEIESATRRVYELLTARNRRVKFETTDEKKARIATADAEYFKAATVLSQVLLGPVAAQLGQKRLLIVSDGALHYVPFAALPVPAAQVSGVRGQVPGDVNATRHLTPNTRPLIIEHEIVNLPSASTLAVLRREVAGRQPAPKTIAVLADPVFEKDDERVKAIGSKKRPEARSVEMIEARGTINLLEASVAGFTRQSGIADEGLRIGRLPFTRHEADKILSLAPEGERLKAVDFDASRATATSSELGQYRFIHFATHGFLNSEHPELSGIVLSLIDQKGIEQDGFLRAHEVFNLRLPAELVVLSGCRTGLGKEIKGEGLIGLTRGFMYAGSARVLVSLWDVSDQASAELMAQFYQGMLGKERFSPASALRMAQISIWKEKRWQAPYYWAAFVLQGEMR